MQTRIKVDYITKLVYVYLINNSPVKLTSKAYALLYSNYKSSTIYARNIGYCFQFTVEFEEGISFHLIAQRFWYLSCILPISLPSITKDINMEKLSVVSFSFLFRFLDPSIFKMKFVYVKANLSMGAINHSHPSCKKWKGKVEPFVAPYPWCDW